MIIIYVVLILEYLLIGNDLLWCVRTIESFSFMVYKRLQHKENLTVSENNNQINSKYHIKRLSTLNFISQLDSNGVL